MDNFSILYDIQLKFRLNGQFLDEYTFQSIYTVLSEMVRKLQRLQPRSDVMTLTIYRGRYRHFSQPQSSEIN